MLSSTILSIYEKYRENKLAHAYLVETNNVEQATKDIKELVKAINCPKEYNNDCNQCNLCNLIDKNNLPNLIIIEPDGQNIKKNQIEVLKKSFSTKPIYSKYNCYIVKNAEKLNGSSANAMLKFVEDPTEGILGFFITTNKDVIIDTIKSRCQSYVFYYESKNIKENLNINEEEFASYKETIKKYLKDIYLNNFINHKKDILSIYQNKEEIIKLLKIILELYYNTYLKNNNLVYNDETLDIFDVEDSNKDLVKKINVITKTLQEMSYNVNIELALDKFVIEMRGIYE